MNILIVDDEPLMLQSIRVCLENNTYRVFEAQSAQQAIELLTIRAHEIDLLITDYVMPQMNGIELLKAIRKSHPFLPVIITSASSDKNMILDALKYRCSSFIEKPFKPEQLIAEIESIQIDIVRNAASCDFHKQIPNIKHRIRNPLFIISGSAEMIMSNRNNVDKLQNNIDNIIDSVAEIKCLFDEISVRSADMKNTDHGNENEKLQRA